MSNLIADHAEIPVKDRKEVVLHPRGNYTAEEIAFAKSEGLDELETRYVLLEAPRPEAFRTPSGNTYRCAGRLYVRMCTDGVRRFVAYMHEDSYQHDFRYFDRVINAARFGRMDGWARYTFKDGSEGWMFEAPNYGIVGKHDFRPARIRITSPTEGAGHNGYGETWGYVCEEPLCREEFHDQEDPSHILESLENTFSDKAGYEIEICKDPTRPDSRWYVNLWMSEDLTELTPDDVAKFANDLQWMGIECATANAKQVAGRAQVSA